MSWYARRVIGLLLMLVLVSSTAWAGETKLKIKGQVRFRALADDKSFDKADMQFFNELRTRLAITAKPQENLKLFAQLQDSRVVGSNSGGLGNDTNVGLHQGYFVYTIGRGWSFKGGRFEMVYGDQRLVGSVGWHNVGRTWDGARFRKDAEKWYLDLFAVQLNETAFSATNPDEDRSFGGATVHLKEKNVEAFFWADRNKTPGAGFADRDDKRFTTGVFSSRKIMNNIDYICTAALQFGPQESTTAAVVDTSGDTTTAAITMETDISSAYLLSLEAGYTAAEGKVRVAALFDYSSGDDDAADDKMKAFNNLYYTGHKFRGYMDNFLASNNLGLMDIALRLKVKASDRWTVKADAHMFRAAEEYTVATAKDDAVETESAIGNEIDLTAAFKDGSFGFVLGASTFIAADDADGYSSNLVGGETATWGYAMCIANF